MTFTKRCCIECKKDFLVLKKYAIRPGRGVYCSRSCHTSAKNHAKKGKPSGRYQNGEANPNWKGGVSKINIRYTDRFRERFPEKVSAHEAVKRAIKTGSISRQPCVRCGGSDRIHAHHKDYSKPLDVMWLCQPCHIQEHVRISRGEL